MHSIVVLLANWQYSSIASQFHMQACKMQLCISGLKTSQTSLPNLIFAKKNHNHKLFSIFSFFFAIHPISVPEKFIIYINEGEKQSKTMYSCLSFRNLNKFLAPCCRHSYVFHLPSELLQNSLQKQLLPVVIINALFKLSNKQYPLSPFITHSLSLHTKKHEKKSSKAS